MSNFSDRLKQERERLGFIQPDFAEIGGVKKGAQVNYESGKRQPDSDYLQKIAAAGADVHYILTGNRVFKINEESPSYELRPDQAALLDNYEHCSKELKRAVAKLALIGAEPDQDEPQQDQSTQLKVGNHD